MKNIEYAIEQYKLYQNERLIEQNNAVNIYDYLLSAGYVDINEFLFDKSIYELKHLKYEIVEEPEITQQVPIPYLQNKQNAFLYTIDCSVNYGFVSSNFDKDKESILLEYNYIPTYLGYENSKGPILSNDQDLRIYLIVDETIKIPYNYFLNKLCEYLKNYYQNTVIDNNDIMINGKKVCGNISINYNNMDIFMFQINFVDKAAAVKAICGPSVKIPGFIDSSIVSQQQIKNEFLSWLVV